MYRPATPDRVMALAERLATYFEEDDLLIYAHMAGRQGMYIAVSMKDTPDVRLLLHADELDNGASGFKENALLRIQAFRDSTPYVPTQPKGIRYDDVMTYDGGPDGHPIG